MASIASVSVSAATVKYISDIRTGCADSISAAKKILTDEGYTVIHHDMNNKVPNQKKWIYVGYKTTTNPDEAITGLVFSNEKKDSIYYNEKTYTIEKGKSDFNAGAGGDYIYLYYTKDKDASYTTEYLTALDVVASTDSCSLYKKNYKTVGSTSSNYSMNANEGVDGAKPVYLVYQSVLDSNAYEKQGTNELESTVKSVNGVTYYDSGDDASSTEYFETALLTEYNGTSQVELWADVFYSMIEIKGQNNGYRNDTGNDFDQMYGKGDYIDMVSALTNGTGNMSSDFWDLYIESTGLQTAGSPQEVYNEVIKMFTTLSHGDVGVDCGDYSTKNIENEVVDLDGLKNATSSSDVLYTICRVADDNRNGDESQGHDKSTTVMGMMFYNFELVPLLEDGNTGADLLNYSEEYETYGSQKSSTQIVVNDTENEDTSSKTYTSTNVKSSTNSHSDTNGNDVNYTQGFSAHLGTGDGIPVDVGAEITLGWEEAFSFSETNTTENLISEDISVSDTLSMVIPPFSIGTINCDSSTMTQKKSYDCPMAITYDVALFSTSAELGKENMFYTSFAYNSSLYATFGDENTTAVEALENVMKSSGKNTEGFSVKCVGGDDHKTKFTSYSIDEWNKIINNYVASGEYPISTVDAMNRIINYQPMSFNGGTVTTKVDNVSYTTSKNYSLYPIDKIKVYKTNFASESQSLVTSINLNSEKEYKLQDYYNEIKAYTKYNTEFTNWDATQGYWVLVSEDGTETRITDTPVSDGVISARMDKITGNIYLTPISNGTSYVRYKINENDTFQYYSRANDTSTTFSSSNVKGCTNDWITQKGTIEIKSNIS